MNEELAPMREQVWQDPRPKEYFDRFHERTRTRPPDWVYPTVRGLTGLWARVAYRARAVDAGLVPQTGPLLIAPNHFSFMDHFFVGAFAGRPVQFMAKSQMFKPPLQWIYTHGGVFPVRRGHRDDEAFLTAHTVLGRGGCVTMYPEAGRSRTGQLAERARAGIGRLALESGAPVVPVAVHGSQGVRNWKRLQFPTVTIRFGAPLRFEHDPAPTRDRQQAVADEVFAAIRRLYAELDGLPAGRLRQLRARRRTAA